MALNTCKFEIISLNCRSMNRNWKSLKFLLLPLMPNCDVMALSETWLNVPETVDARHQQEGHSCNIGNAPNFVRKKLKTMICVF